MTKITNNITNETIPIIMYENLNPYLLNNNEVIVHIIISTIEIINVNIAKRVCLQVSRESF